MSAHQFTFQLNGPGSTLAIGAALPAVCIVVVSLRFLTRCLQKVRIGLDDWLSLGGLASVIGMGACLIYGAVKGALGYPTPEGPASIAAALTYVDPKSVIVLKMQFWFQIIMMLSNGFIKLSVIAFYRRLFCTPAKRGKFEKITKFVAVVAFLWTVTFFFIDIFVCGRHVTSNWGPLQEQLDHCPDGYTTEYGFAISDFILDAIILALPLPAIWSLHMSSARKVAVSGVILLGATSVAASLTRLVIYVEVLDATTAGIKLDSNLLITSSLWWSMLEAGLGLISACLPTLSYLFTHYSLKSVASSVRNTLSRRSTPSHSLLQESHSPGNPTLGRYSEMAKSCSIKSDSMGQPASMESLNSLQPKQIHSEKGISMTGDDMV